MVSLLHYFIVFPCTKAHFSVHLVFSGDDHDHCTHLHRPSYLSTITGFESSLHEPTAEMSPIVAAAAAAAESARDLGTVEHTLGTASFLQASKEAKLRSNFTCCEVIMKQ